MGTSALAAGFLVVVITLLVVFASDISDFTASLLTDEDNNVTVSESEVDSDDSESAPPAPDHQRLGTYIEGDVGFPETLNPLLAESAGEQTVATMLYRRLMSTGASGDPEPDLAIDWEVAPDGLTHSITLDPEAQWHDGQPLTVADVLFTIGLIKDAEFPGDQDLSRFWRAITPRKTGDHSIDFELLEPYVEFGHYLRLPILPKHQFGDVLPGDLRDVDFGDDQTGSGPYALDSLDRSASEIRFRVASPGDDPGFESITYRYFNNRSEVIQAFQNGDLDGIAYLPLSALNDDALLPPNTRVHESELSGYTALYFNLRHPHFRDVRTRHAFEHAIDRESIVALVLGGHATPGTSPIPEMSSAHNPGDHRNYDPEIARDLLDAAGWIVEGQEEFRQRDGEYLVIPLIVNGDDPQRIAIAAEIQSDLRNVGVAVEIQSLPSGEVQQALDSRQFTAALFGWRTENGNLDCFQMWHSTQSEDGANFTGFADAEADELLQAARRSVSIDERNEHYAGFQEIFAEQVPAVVLFYPRYHFAVSDRVEGAEPGPLVNPGDRVRRILEWYER